jgi:hypothetical protein
VSLVGGTATAFAGWSPTPTRASAAQLATAKTNCASQSPIAGLPLQLTDTRGPYTFEVYASDTASAVCVSSPSFHSISGMQSTRDPEFGDLTPPADTVAGMSSHLLDPQGNGYSFADGRTGSGVTGVTLVLSDGTQVQATVQNGWFVAWWPSAASLNSAQLATADGTKTQTVMSTQMLGAQGGGSPGSGVVSSGFASGGASVSGPNTSTGSSTTASPSVTTSSSASASGTSTSTTPGT